MIFNVEDLNDLEKLTLLDISYSRLSTYAECPARYFYRYIEKGEEVFSPYAALGNLVHATLEVFVGDELNLVDMLQDFEFNQRPRYDPERQIPEKLIDVGVQLLTEYVDNHGDETPQILAKELPFEIVVAGCRINGYIDRVEREKDYILIQDYKTGMREVAQKDIATNLQLGIYALAVSHIYPNEKIKAELYYLRSGRRKGHFFTLEDLEQVEVELTQKVEQLRSDLNFVYTDNPRFCSYCDFRLNKKCAVGVKRLGS